MGSTTPTIKRPIAKIGSAGSDDVLGRIDLIVLRVIIMKVCAAFLAGLRNEFGLAPVFGCSMHRALVNAWRGIGITSQKQIGCTPMVCCSDYVAR
jgi:hypothetical protein